MLVWVEGRGGGFDPFSTLYEEMKGNGQVLVDTDLPSFVLEDFVRTVVCALVVLLMAWEKEMMEEVDRVALLRTL